MFLILDQGGDNMGLAKEMLQLVKRRPGIGRHGIGAQHRHRGHASIKPDAIVTQNDDRITGLDPQGHKASGTAQNLLGIGRPGHFCPNATVFLTHGNIATMFGRIAHQQTCNCLAFGAWRAR